MAREESCTNAARAGRAYFLSAPESLVLDDPGPAGLALPRDSVARRFFRRAFGVFIVFAVLLTSILIGETLWVAQENLKIELAIYQRTFEKSLAAALWSMDREKLESIVRGIVEIPDIEGVRVVDPQDGTIIVQAGVFVALGQGGAHPLAHRFDVIHEDGYGREMVARAEFQSSFSQLLQRTQRQILLIVVLASLKTLALWGIFLWVGKRLLGWPLTEMTCSIRASEAPERLQLSARTERAIADTELALLRDAYDSLALRMGQAQDALARTNAELDQRVRERTLELQEANRKLEELAHTDALTGLANRREFLAVAETAIGRARRGGRPLSLIVCDIDKFKQVNDVHGHMVGDRVICHVAESLFSAVRHVDLVARLGGDEFVVLLPDIGPDEARVVAERIRDMLAASRLELATGASVGTCVSLGLATLEAEDERIEELFQRADTALYAAKTSGRNRVIDHSRLPDAP
jgi:diguanylate cyclase (GGDEF)-like protein